MSYISQRQLRFLLYEVLDAPALNRLPYFQDYDREAFDMVLDAAGQLADQYLFPFYREMDKAKARYDNGAVRVHASLQPALRALAEGGWISAPFPYEAGGQQMPFSLLNAGLLTFYAANANTAGHAFLTQGAANLIRTFGAASLQEQYLPHMLSGVWQGTMALTEPQAGSSLSDVMTSADPDPAGYYRINGQKIFISGGEHEAVDNVVHLLLARIKGAPAGTKGISLFVVPKYRPENGALVSNNVHCAGIYGKMGQRGYVAAHLMYGEQGECRGYLVGQPHHGLAYMFQMMNEARIGTGLMATGAASGAYHASLRYAQERPQGRPPSNKDVSLPQIPIIEHADVRRMLLFQKAVVEGSMSLLMYCSQLADIAHYGQGKEQQEAKLLLEMLTPIAKSYPAEMGTQSVSTGMQVLGGAGYTDDFPLEQYYRDIRVNAIYEGTTGIHGLDLLGRKVFMEKGAGVQLLQQNIRNTMIQALDRPDLMPMGQRLSDALHNWLRITGHLTQLAQKAAAEVFLADATLYLEYTALLVQGWQWLRMALVAEKAKPEGQADKDFYQGKLRTCRYYFEYELPKYHALHTRLLSDERLTLEMDTAWL